MGVTAGEVLGFKAPASGESVYFPVIMLDSTGDRVAELAYSDVTVQVATDGGALSAWPSWGTGNWVEVGEGMYWVVARGSVAAEVALFAEGHLALYISSAGTRGDFYLYKINREDSLRVGDSYGVGTGVFSVTLRLQTSLDELVIHGKISISGVGSAITGEDGEALFYLSAGTYTYTVQSAPNYAGETGTLTVDSDGDVEIDGVSGSVGIIELEAVEVPSPSSPDEVVLYSDEYDPYGSRLVGAGDRVAYAVSVVGVTKFSAVSKAHFQGLSDRGDGASTDANGRWYMTVPADIEMVIKIVDTVSQKVECWKVKVPDTSGSYSLWELHPEEVTLLV